MLARLHVRERSFHRRIPAVKEHVRFSVSMRCVFQPTGAFVRPSLTFGLTGFYFPATV